jgi:hypothetical protein
LPIIIGVIINVKMYLLGELADFGLREGLALEECCDLLIDSRDIIEVVLI